jgi:hypothetical protein
MLIALGQYSFKCQVLDQGDIPSTNREGVSLGTDFLRPDLGRVEKAWYNDEHAEGPEEDKEHRGRGHTQSLYFPGIIRCIHCNFEKRRCHEKDNGLDGEADQ